LSLDIDSLEEGLPFASGYVTSSRGDQLLRFVLDDAEEGRFSVISSGRAESARYAQGSLEVPSSGGMLLDLEFLEPKAYTLLGTDAHVGITLPPGLFGIPGGTNSVSLTTEFHSVSIDPSSAESLVRKQTATVNCSAPSESYPNVTSMSPLLLKRGERCVVRGSNFGESPRLYIRTLDGSRESLAPYSSSDTELELVLPMRVRDDQIQVENAEGGRSNRYTPRFGFSPVPAIELLAEDGGAYELRWHVSQSSAYPQPRASRFRIQLFDADCDFDALSIGQEVGTVDRELGGDSGGYHESRLQVSRVETDGVELQVVASYNPDNVYGLLSVSRDGGASQLVVEFEPDENYDVLDLAYYLAWDWTLTDLPVTFSDSEALQRAIFEMNSFPLEEGGQSAEENLVFVAESQP